MRYFHLLIFLIILCSANVESISLRARGGQSCAFLSRKIYCFGGYVEGKPEDNAWHSLDIYKNNGAPIDQLNSLWESLPAPANFVIESNYNPQVAAAPDGISFLIQGGRGLSKKPYVNQTIAYNSRTNSWESFANYNDIKNGGDRQISFGSGVHVPSLDGFGFYGGRQKHAIVGSSYITPDDSMTISNQTYIDSENIPSSRIGFYYFTLFNMKTNTWTVPTQTNVPKRFSVDFSATYHPETKKIFYIGGNFVIATDEKVSYINMSYATTFDTSNGNWLEERIYGNPPPTNRKRHTATLLPNGNDILLYGGADLKDLAATDYCFTLNISNMSWTFHDLAAPTVESYAPRSQHSAVLVNDTSLFILFGREIGGAVITQLLVLDVRNVSNIMFAKKFPFDDSTSEKNGTNISKDDNGDEERLSIGAIVGIAVGGIAVVALAIFGVVCCIRKKKTKQAGTQHGNDNHFEAQNETLEVDWDRIDNHYKEVAFPPSIDPPTTYQQQQGQRNSTQQHYISGDLYSEANSSTVISGSQPPHTSATTSPVTRLAGVSSNPYKTKPSIAEPILPDTSLDR